MTSPHEPNLPPLRDVIKAFGLDALKGLGQHFLLDPNLTDKIARQAGSLDQGTTIEIGPGPGGLTRSLLARGAEKVVVIEKDRRCLPALQDLAKAYPGRLEIVEADALKIDETDWIDSGHARIVSNLPYNVGTPLLMKWLSLDPWPPWYESLTLMFQREVADRIVSAPGSKSYGRLSVISQWRCTTQKCLNVPARAFTPPPKVDSSVISLKPKADATDPNLFKAIEKVTAAAFGQRRKMLRASLKSLFPETEKTLHSLGISPTERAEQLSVENFARLAESLNQLNRR